MYDNHVNIATGPPGQAYDWNTLGPSGEVANRNEIYVDPTWVDSCATRKWKDTEPLFQFLNLLNFP